MNFLKANKTCSILLCFCMTPKDNKIKVNAVEVKASAENSTKQNFPWYKLLAALSISGVLMWGSAYAAQQSTKHRKSEKRTRWFALEVKALDPFISSMNSEQQNELKNELSKRMFGQYNNNDGDDESPVINEHAFKTIIDAVGGIIVKAKT